MSEDEGDKTPKKTSSKEDPTLWEVVQQLAQGSVEDRIRAVETIFLRPHDLPAVSTKLAQKLAQRDQPKEVRLAVANNLLKNKHIPTEIYFDILKSLSADKDKDIQKMLDKILQEDVQFQKLISGFNSYLNSHLTKTMQEFNKRQQELFGQNLNIIPGKSILPLFNLSDTLGEQAARTARIHTYGYYPEVELDTVTTSPKIPPKSKAEELLERLKKCQPGLAHWREYEDVCRDILSYCLVPPLLDPAEQSVTGDGFHKRDFIFSYSNNPYGGITRLLDVLYL